ncbi:MAG: endopeptidase La [Spirochaetaceae bacterium]|nr:endopeptidase La [Spirochaetaceae bacterium]
MENVLRKDIIVLPLEDAVIFPGVTSKVKVDQGVANALKDAADSETTEGHIRVIALTMDASGRDSADEPTAPFFPVGVSGSVLGQHATDDGAILDFRADSRVRVSEIIMDGTVPRVPVGTVVPLMTVEDLDDKSHKDMVLFAREAIREIGKNFRGAEAFINPVLKMESITMIMAATMPYTPISVAEKQELLEIDSLRDRALRFIDILMIQKNSIEMQLEIARKSSEQTNRTYREHMLRQQLKAIKEELGEDESDLDGNGEKSYRERIEEAALPKKAHEAAVRQAKRLEDMEKTNPEASMIRNYLDLILALPWNPAEPDEVDLVNSRKVLDSHHYGLKDVKERIIQHLAVMKLKKEKQGSILLLVGPPGTGKTSLGKSIAQALGRPYIRASLGGVRDEAEIRGHRRTYIGSLPGRIISGMRQAETRNPVFVLDEVDKLSSSFAGDPVSALLEVLDPEQNSGFTDHYLEIPYDLSDVFFIGTANSTSGIPAPLLDRTEIIEVSGYTNHEKLRIAADHLVPKVLEEHGLDTERLDINEEALSGIIETYTREAGVRGLAKQLAKIARVASEKIVSGKVERPWHVGKDDLKDLLGRPKVRLDDMQKKSLPGVATGLAWTPVGGDILFVEAGIMPGKGGLTLTGQLGDVMKESASIALSLVRSRLGQSAGPLDFMTHDVHVHVPAGAVPKDGPSAGVTITAALASLLLGKSVPPATAMTGEITLRGAVLPVGGIKEKIIAAHRAGAKKVILPTENEKDLEDVPEDVRSDIEFIPIATIEELMEAALEVTIPESPEITMMVDNGNHSGSKFNGGSQA